MEAGSYSVYNQYNSNNSFQPSIDNGSFFFQDNSNSYNQKKKQKAINMINSRSRFSFLSSSTREQFISHNPTSLPSPPANPLSLSSPTPINSVSQSPVTPTSPSFLTASAPHRTACHSFYSSFITSLQHPPPQSDPFEDQLVLFCLFLHCRMRILSCIPVPLTKSSAIYPVSFCFLLTTIMHSILTRTF